MITDKYIQLLSLTLKDMFGKDYSDRELYLKLKQADNSLYNKYIVNFRYLEKSLDLEALKDLYLDLLKKSISDFLKGVITNFERPVEELEKPTNAMTMLSIQRLDNIHYCVSEVLKNNISGDLIETGVWRGGATILMKGILEIYQENTKKVWVVDSFEGLPKPNIEKYPEDKDNILYTNKNLNVSLDSVKDNFRKYGFLDDKVKFLKGWFKDSLPNAPIEKLALLRLDGDMYESTIDPLIYLYPKLEKGGFIIIDDWGVHPECRKAVEDYRQKHNITEEIITIDRCGVFWQKNRM